MSENSKKPADGQRISPIFSPSEPLGLLLSLSPEQVTGYLMDTVFLVRIFSPISESLKKKDQWFLDYSQKEFSGLFHVNSILGFRVEFQAPHFYPEKSWSKEQMLYNYNNYEDDYYARYQHLFDQVKRYKLRLRYLLPIEKAPSIVLRVHLVRLRKLINLINGRIGKVGKIRTKKQLYRLTIRLLYCEGLIKNILRERSNFRLTNKGL